MSLKELICRNNNIPYYYFTYQGDFYKDLKVKNMIFTDGTRINSFFNQKTFEQHDFEQPYVRFKKATMFIIHYFPDQIGRDLDNYMYKPVIDSLRKTGIFFDDTWQHLSLFLLGDHAKQEKIEVFLVPHHSTTIFMQGCMSDRFLHEKVSEEIIYPKHKSVTQLEEKEDNNEETSISFW